MFAQIAPAFLEEILIFLIPIFMAGAHGSIAAARQAALAALAAHDPATEQELRLAAQITQYGFSILESLAQATNPELALNTVLRLRGNANAMQRSANQCQRVLDRLRRERRALAASPAAVTNAGAIAAQTATGQPTAESRLSPDQPAEPSPSNAAQPSTPASKTALSSPPDHSPTSRSRIAHPPHPAHVAESHPTPTLPASCVPVPPDPTGDTRHHPLLRELGHELGHQPALRPAA